MPTFNSEKTDNYQNQKHGKIKKNFTSFCILFHLFTHLHLIDFNNCVLDALDETTHKLDSLKFVFLSLTWLTTFLNKYFIIELMLIIIIIWLTSSSTCVTHCVRWTWGIAELWDIYDIFAYVIFSRDDDYINEITH